MRLKESKSRFKYCLFFVCLLNENPKLPRGKKGGEIDKKKGDERDKKKETKKTRKKEMKQTRKKGEKIDKKKREEIDKKKQRKYRKGGGVYGKTLGKNNIN